jgi:DNA-binding beta-propeller fold protein YncE
MGNAMGKREAQPMVPIPRNARRWQLLPAAIVLASAVFTAKAEAPLTLEANIPLERVSGRIDHMAIDLDRKRLIVAELGNNSVDVIDIARRSVVHRIGGLKEPQGVAYVKGPDLIAVANAGDGSVRLFHGIDFTPAGTVALGDDADNLRVDPTNGRLIAGYGRGALAIIDPSTAAKVSEIFLPAHPEGFRLHPRDGRTYVNVPDARTIAVVDRAAAKPMTTWDTTGLRANFPMAISADGHTVYVVFRNPARLVLFDADSGSQHAAIDACGDADDVFPDGKRLYVYVSCGEGVVDVLEEQSDGLQRLGRVPTFSGARTSLFVPELDRLFVAARAGPAGRSAAILVFRPER